MGGKEQDWMGCLQRNLSLFNLPIGGKQWTLAAKESGNNLFKRVEEAAEKCMKRWFVKQKENVAKRRALEVQHAQQLIYGAVDPKARGERKRSRVEEGMTAARPVKKVKAPVETWHWPSFYLRRPVATA